MNNTQNTFTYVVYKATLPNGKMYIGVASNLKKRINNHKSQAKSKQKCTFHNALNKYGFENCIWEVLVNCSSFEIALECEKSLIKSFKTKTPYGYNLTDGGEGVRGLKQEQPKKFKRVINLATHEIYPAIKIAAKKLGVTSGCVTAHLRGKTKHCKGYVLSFYKEDVNYPIIKKLEKINNRNYEGTSFKKTYKTPYIPKNKGKKMSPEFCEKIRQANLSGKCGNRGKKLNLTDEERKIRAQRLIKFNKENPDHGIGRITSEETKMKQAKIKNPYDVLCIELNKRYYSVSAAAKDLNIGRSSITNVLSGLSKTAGGFTFRRVYE